MPSEPPSLSELERDALTEIVNIGVSRAAAALRRMVGQLVVLSVPSVELVDYATAEALIDGEDRSGIIAVRQSFAGFFSGNAFLIFTAQNGATLARAILGDDDAPDMEAETLAETGNIILTGCLATVANMLEQHLNFSVPQVMRGRCATVFGEAEAASGALVLFLYVTFSVRGREISGYIAMVMDLPALGALRVLLGRFIARVLADDAAPEDHTAPGAV